MNEKLQTLITQLNASQVVSLPEFIQAIEEETLLNLSSIFSGTLLSGGSINWKNIIDDVGEIKNQELFLVDNTINWNFSLTKYDIKNVQVFLRVESTDNIKSLISVVIIGQLNSEDISFPVIMLKSEDFINSFLYLDNGSSIYYEKNVIESFLDSPDLLANYPAPMNNINGLNCFLIRLIYSISRNSYIHFLIESSAPDWSIGEIFILNLEQCTIQCCIPVPYNHDYLSFIIKGNLILNNNTIPGVSIKLPSIDDHSVSVTMYDGNEPMPSLADLSYLFYKSDVISLLPLNLGGINDLILRDFCLIYQDDITNISCYSIGISTANTGVEWNIIPQVLTIKHLSLDFYYEPLSCDLAGVLSLGNCDVNLNTKLDFRGGDSVSTLLFFLDNETSRGVNVDLSDFSIFGLSILNDIPFIENINFKLYDLFLSINLSPSVELNKISFAVATQESWQILSSIKIEELTLNLDFDFDNNIISTFGNLSGLISIHEFQINIKGSIPSSGDWSLSLMKDSDQVVFDELTVQVVSEDKPGIPIPGIADILSLFGPNLSIADKLPTALKLEGIELTDLLIKFPNPTEMKIHTADFEIRLTSEWTLTSAFELKNIIFQCGIDFTGTEPDYVFSILGKVTIVDIDLSTVVTKTADGSWSFSISLDPSAEEKPNVKRMLSDLLHFNLPGIFPDVTVSGMEFTGDITGDICNYKFNLLLTEVWNLKALTGLDIELKEISITGESNNGIIGGKITGIVELGGVTLSLSAGLAPSGGAGAGDLVFHGNLADGSNIGIIDLLNSIHINVSNIPILDTFEIDQLDFSFNTGTGKSDLVIGCGFMIDLFGRSGLELRGALSFSKATSSSEMTGTITGKLYLKSLCFEASFPIENIDEDHITLKLYLPKPGQPDNPTCVTCNIINENGNKRLSINLGQMNIFTMLEQLVNLMIPGMYLDFPSPWNRLESIQYSGAFVLNIDLPQDYASPIKATIVIPVGLINKLPMIELNTFVMNCNFDAFTIDVQMAGEIFGIDYNSGFDLISEDPPTPALPMGLLDLRYAGFGRHVSLNEQTNYTSMREVIQKLRDAFEQKPNSVVGSNIFGTLGYNSESDWLIGFDFTVAQFLRLSVIFNDPILYGMLIRLDGPAAGMFSGFEFEILYQRLAAGIGAYRMKLELPAYLRTIELGAVSLTLPFIGIDIYTNGNFKLDLGFPYQSNFERSFALSLFPFYGKGGFYFASLNGATSTSVPRIRNGKFEPVIEFGIGLQVGIGMAA